MDKSARWLVAYGVTWIALAGASEIPALRSLASTLAVTIAFSAAMVNGPRVLGTLAKSV